MTIMVLRMMMKIEVMMKKKMVLIMKGMMMMIMEMMIVPMLALQTTALKILMETMPMFGTLVKGAETQVRIILRVASALEPLEALGPVRAIQIAAPEHFTLVVREPAVLNLDGLPTPEIGYSAPMEVDIAPQTLGHPCKTCSPSWFHLFFLEKLIRVDLVSNAGAAPPQVPAGSYRIEFVAAWHSLGHERSNFGAVCKVSEWSYDTRPRPGWVLNNFLIEFDFDDTPTIQNQAAEGQSEEQQGGLNNIVNAEKRGKRQVLIRPSSKAPRGFPGYIGDLEIIDDHRAGKVVVELIGRLNKCGVISPRFDALQREFVIRSLQQLRGGAAELSTMLNFLTPPQLHDSDSSAISSCTDAKMGSHGVEGLHETTTYGIMDHEEVVVA
ncbi:40S ribosomal protein S15a-4 [Symbiodinium microadriaticum]|uniref:40S ribosomal protein S15a-4 n=1 Tax=Symbiodinium microadriaticum TaxID=2951 RepID=A0A1Q9EVD0_SYMMI|nr:40S ribosomal protein S15a-4 [Symbiodinium microadriaticum]